MGPSTRGGSSLLAKTIAVHPRVRPKCGGYRKLKAFGGICAPQVTRRVPGAMLAGTGLIMGALIDVSRDKQQDVGST
jgi:hypothetical protein